jgi:predicted MFS family arabinose efflux permease
MQSNTKFTRYQKGVIAVLAFLQFTIILDFMILSPLGVTVMEALQVTPSQFGVVVSAYAFSAGVSGILSAGIADRFDRKKLLLAFYAGFILGTFFCAFAPNFHFLLAARIVTGFFAGVMGSVVLAITADLFSLEQRGRVMGFIQTAFAGSQVLGIPIGMFISNLWGWHMPFFMIAIVATCTIGFIAFYLKPVNAHLQNPHTINPFLHLWGTLTTPRYLFAFSTTIFLGLGGYMLMPFASAFTVHNLGIDLVHLPMIYFISGICAIFTGPLIGKLSDSFGKYRVFLFGAILNISTVLVYTNLGVTSVPVVAFILCVLWLGIFSRMIPAQALLSAIPHPTTRGSFMALNSSVQQLSGGLASIISGAIVVQSSTGRLENFNILGLILGATVLVSAVMMYFVNRMIHHTPKAPTKIPEHS